MDANLPSRVNKLYTDIPKYQDFPRLALQDSKSNRVTQPKILITKENKVVSTNYYL